MKSRGGFTFTEVMIVVMILSVMALIAPRLFSQLFQFYAIHSAKIEIQRDARVALDMINRMVREGTASSVVIDRAAGQPPCSRLTFRTTANQTIEFYQKGNELFEVQNTTTSISKNLEFLAFSYPQSDDPSVITVSMTMSKLAFQGVPKTLDVAVEKVRVMNP